MFEWLKTAANIDETEMHRTFNCGIGMTVTVPAATTAAALASLRGAGETAFVIGEIRAGSRGVVLEG